MVQRLLSLSPVSVSGCCVWQSREMRFDSGSRRMPASKGIAITHHMGDEKGTRSNCYLHVITLQHMTRD